jgi:hypothetical protein
VALVADPVLGDVAEAAARRYELRVLSSLDAEAAEGRS